MGWSRTCRPRRAAGERQGARAFADPRLAQRIADDRRRRRDRHLLEAELDVAVVHHDVEELRHVRLQHEHGHACATDALWVDDAVGASPAQLLDALVDAHPRHDEQIGTAGPSR